MDGRRLVAVVIRGGERQNPAYRTTRSPLARLAHRLVQLFQGTVQLPTGISGHVVFLCVEQSVGEGVLARGPGRICLLTQMRSADDAVLMVAKQALDVLGPLGH